MIPLAKDMMAVFSGDELSKLRADKLWCNGPCGSAQESKSMASNLGEQLERQSSSLSPPIFFLFVLCLFEAAVPRVLSLAGLFPFYAIMGLLAANGSRVFYFMHIVPSRRRSKVRAGPSTTCMQDVLWRSALHGGVTWPKDFTCSSIG